MFPCIENRVRLVRLTLLTAAGLAAAWLLSSEPGASSKGLPLHRFQKQKAAQNVKPSPREDKEFEKHVLPALTDNCLGCHNDRKASGSLNLGLFLDRSTLESRREEWEAIRSRVEAGEMPPPGAPKEPAQIASMLLYLRTAFENADRALKAEPGRVAAKRLNRVEYANTIRDLFGVSYQADREFPRDDEGEGFDNIADLLSVSPMLAERYMAASSIIAAKAMGTIALPPATEFGYTVNQDPKIRKHAEALIYYGQEAWLLDPNTMEFNHHIDYDGEYKVQIDVAGYRGKQSPPTKVGLWMDGKLLEVLPVETKTSTQDGFGAYPYRGYQTKYTLPQGAHRFRLALVDDALAKQMSESDAYNPRKNVFPYGVRFLGPFPAQIISGTRKKILICDPNSGLLCQRKIVATLARRAFRRAVDKSEIDSLMGFVKMAETPEQGIELAIRAMLVSPHFLFRIERDPIGRTMSQTGRITDFELASRLSYFLWSSTPDDALLRLAETGRLKSPAVLRAQVSRMLADPKSAALAENFAGQWLQLRNLGSIRPDAEKFPEWGADLREAMRTETQMFFGYLLLENRPLSEFLDARYTFLNERLAKFYGVPDVTGAEFRRVELRTEQRGGIMAQGSVLAVSSYPTRTSVVLRGKFVLENLFNTPPPPPPPNVPVIDDSSVGAKASLRQQMEAHRANPSCAACHNRLDPIGFALENYDAIGRWRTKDGEFPVDVSGVFPRGKAFSNPSEFRAALAAKTPEFSQALTEKLMTYALGRRLERFDKPTIGTIQSRVASSGYRFQTLIQEIVRSLPFQERRVEADLSMRLHEGPRRESKTD